MLYTLTKLRSKIRCFESIKNINCSIIIDKDSDIQYSEPEIIKYCTNLYGTVFKKKSL